MKTRINLLATILLLIAFALSAQIAFRHWDESGGLPSDQVRNISSLSDGRISFRIPNGLIVFDGSDFHTYYIDRSQQYPIKFYMKSVYQNYDDANGRLWMKSPGHLSVFDSERSEFIYNIDSLLRTDYGVQSPIDDIFIDTSNDIWFVTADKKLQYYDRSRSALVTLVRLDGEWAIRHHGGIIEVFGNENEAVIATRNGIMKNWDKKRRQFTGCDETFMGKMSDPDLKLRYLTDPQGRKWLMYNTELWVKPSDKAPWERFMGISGASNFFTDMDIDHDGKIWLATSWSGFRLIDTKTMKYEEYRGLPLESGDILSNDIQDVFVDRQGGVWMGTLWQGVGYYHKNMTPFQTFHTGPADGRRANESVRAFLELPGGNILIATSYNGLVEYNPTTEEVKPYRPDLFPKGDVYMCLYTDSQGALWVGTYLNGFYRLMPDGTLRQYNYDTQASTNVSRSVFEDPKGRFWVSVRDAGVGRLDPESGHIEMLSDRHPKLAFHKRDIGFTALSETDICVYGDEGVFSYNTETDSVFVPRIDGDRNRLHFAAVNSALLDTRGLAWFATDNGVEIYNMAEDNHADTVLSSANTILPSDYVSGIAEDKFGQMWLTTSGGLVRIIVRPADNGRWDFDLTNYRYDSGLQAGRVTEDALFMSSTGDIYIGAYNGVSRFNPSHLGPVKNAHAQPVLLTGLFLQNRQVKPYEEVNGRVILSKPLLNDQEIRLRHDENFITLRFSSLDFVSGPQTRYRYRLLGYDPEWVEIDAGGEPQAVYTGITPGDYTFEVYASDINGVWSETPATVEIRIDPPLWQTWWAYTIYLLLIAAIAYFALRLYNNYRERKLAEEASRREMAQHDHLNQMKFQFFTNISHEFRTPLALIMTPLSHLIQTEKLVPAVKQKLELIYNNTENLLGLVNRLLDFRKLEMGGEKLNISRCRVEQFIQYLIATFSNMSENKGIEMKLDSHIAEDTDVYLDQHKLRHILTNLYSNAIKFTPRGGHISTILSTTEVGGRRMLQIDVCDTGIGISRKDLPQIFDRFYQAKNSTENPSGSGIGLHLVREYVKLHGGDITVNSREGEGTTFTFTIPMDLAKSAPAEAPQESSENADENGDTPAAVPSDKPRILIAEDNSEFRDFLSEYLSAEYQVIEAVDGVDALEKAGKESPDIIVTDLMMPRMDGLELIGRLKKNLATSHIPVILLTAKASDESRIESYKAGADSYISKPFNYDVLHARVSMLLEQARKRQKSFRRDAEIEPSAVTITSIDEKMVQKALETVEANMDNSSFSTTQLGEALGLSRSQLYRKFESVTGMSPADFILRMRLKRAAQLLRDSKLNVSEIADMTGFNSIKYFNKHFKEEFSQTPTEYRASQRG